MKVKLVVVGGRANQREITLKLPAVIGRSREANLTIGHGLVSRRHCLLHERDGLVFVRDLNSTNGTFFEKQRIIEAALLPDQCFTVGPLTFRLAYDYSGDVSAVPEPQWAAEPLSRPPAAHPTRVAEPSPPVGPWSSEPAALDSKVLQVPITAPNSAELDENALPEENRSAESPAADGPADPSSAPPQQHPVVDPAMFDDDLLEIDFEEDDQPKDG